jgi:hypothetical protein
MENSSHNFFGGTDGNERRQIQFLSNLCLDHINTLWSLEDNVETNKRFRENHHLVSIQVHVITQHLHISLESIDDVLGKVIVVSLYSFHRRLQLKQGNVICDFDWIKLISANS